MITIKPDNRLSRRAFCGGLFAPVVVLQLYGAIA